ncbi:MAG: hypothetical protein HQK83_04390 [Fibrobacteria bacterium]|nr:hypothetical protein [Fibrobacteria bacterium]
MLTRNTLMLITGTLLLFGCNDQKSNKYNITEIQKKFAFTYPIGVESPEALFKGVVESIIDDDYNKFKALSSNLSVRYHRTFEAFINQFEALKKRGVMDTLLMVGAYIDTMTTEASVQRFQERKIKDEEKCKEKFAGIKKDFNKFIDLKIIDYSKLENRGVTNELEPEIIHLAYIFDYEGKKAGLFLSATQFGDKWLFGGFYNATKTPRLKEHDKKIKR